MWIFQRARLHFTLFALNKVDGVSVEMGTSSGVSTKVDFNMTTSLLQGCCIAGYSQKHWHSQCLDINSSIINLHEKLTKKRH